MELLFGAAFAVVGLGAILSLTVSANQMRRVHRETSVAFSACRDKLEELRQVPIADLPTKNGTGFTVGGASQLLKSTPKDVDGLPGSISVVPESTIGSETLYRVHVEVEWVGIAGRRRTRLVTLLADRTGQ